MIRTAPAPQRFIIGSFLFLAAIACVVAPLPLAFRSAGALLFAYLAFSVGGPPAGHLTALLAPPLGLITGDYDWLVMLPIVLSSNLLAMIGLEYGWRYPALAVSPLLQAAPQIFVLLAVQQELFAVELPWEPRATSWLLLHALTALAGVLLTVFLDRKRERESPEA